MSFIFVIEIGVAILAYVMRSELQKSIQREVQLSMGKYDEKHEGVMKTWDVVQHDVSLLRKMKIKNSNNKILGISVIENMKYF